MSVQAITLQREECEFAVSRSAATSDYDKPAFSSTDRQRILAGQFRLLAARLDHRLPIDRRSIRNTLRLCFELLREQAA